MCANCSRKFGGSEVQKLDERLGKVTMDPNIDILPIKLDGAFMAPHMFHKNCGGAVLAIE